jgi:predicted ABC-type ATPase
MDKEVYIVGGSNGAGKTTFAKEFIKVAGLSFLNADEIAKEIDPEDREGGKLKAGRVLFQRLDNLIVKGQSFVIESTLSGLYLKKVVQNLKEAEYKISLLYLFLDAPELAIDRVKIRVIGGGHNIPEADIRRRYHRSKINFWNIYKNLTDEWQLFYNGEDHIFQVAMGVKEDYMIIDAETFFKFMEGIENVNQGKL